MAYATFYLHIAAVTNNMELVKFIIECGADIHAVNNKNKTPVDIAKYRIPDGFIQKTYDDYSSLDMKEVDY